MVQCRKKSSHDCRSDRLTVSTVAATVTVTAAVTVSVTAAVTATAMSTQIYREKNDWGRSHLVVGGMGRGGVGVENIEGGCGIGRERVRAKERQE